MNNKSFSEINICVCCDAPSRETYNIMLHLAVSCSAFFSSYVLCMADNTAISSINPSRVIIPTSSPGGHLPPPATTVVDSIVVAIVVRTAVGISSVVATALLATISSTATLLTAAVARAPIIVASIVATATLLTAAVARRGTPSLVTPFVVIVTGVGPVPAVASAAPSVVVSVVMHPPLAAFLAQFALVLVLFVHLKIFEPLSFFVLDGIKLPC
mmetsp:Transcript_17058/g.25420  ORF Transcript_17058/g.25420 Transcript_17058/m.25420 type:complete len:214 (-) Transcript_17058:99-740(-)